MPRRTGIWSNDKVALAEIADQYVSRTSREEQALSCLSFGEVEVLVDSGGVEGFSLAVWPADLDRVDLCFRSEAEVQAEVAAGVIA